MSILHQIKRSCLDFLFPSKCVVCGREGDFFCSKCVSKIKQNEKQRCPGCGALAKKGAVCLDCNEKYNFEGLLVAANYYENEFLRKAILAYKYKFLKSTAEVFGKMMAQKIKETGFKNYVLVPVPLNWKRKFWRGFNQAEELAKVIGKINEVEVKNILKRTKNTLPQARIKDKRERVLNVQGAFEIKDKNITSKKTYILVDDVCGSGATLSECASVLGNMNAKEVWAVVIARG